MRIRLMWVSLTRWTATSRTRSMSSLTAMSPAICWSAVTADAQPCVASRVGVVPSSSSRATAAEASQLRYSGTPLSATTR